MARPPFKVGARSDSTEFYYSFGRWCAHRSPQSESGREVPLGVAQDDRGVDIGHQPGYDPPGGFGLRQRAARLAALRPREIPRYGPGAALPGDRRSVDRLQYRQAGGSEATGPRGSVWSRSTARSLIASPPVRHRHREVHSDAPRRVPVAATTPRRRRTQTLPWPQPGPPIGALRRARPSPVHPPSRAAADAASL